jgi:hypothetical protein
LNSCISGGFPRKALVSADLLMWIFHAWKQWNVTCWYMNARYLALAIPLVFSGTMLLCVPSVLTQNLSILPTFACVMILRINSGNFLKQH